MSEVDYQNKVLTIFFIVFFFYCVGLFFFCFFFKCPSLKQTRLDIELMQGVCLSSSSGNEEDYMQVCVISIMVRSGILIGWVESLAGM